MIVTINTAKMAQGKASEVVDLWSKFVKHRNKRFPDVERTLLRPLCGELDEIVLVSKHASLSSFEAVIKDEKEDSEWQDLRKRSRPHESQRTRKFYRVVE